MVSILGQALEVGAYVIGLTGGIASGKTSIARRFEKLGAARIDCDALGHMAYLKVPFLVQMIFSSILWVVAWIGSGN